MAWYLLDADPLAEPESVCRAFAGEPVARQRVDALFVARGLTARRARRSLRDARTRTEVDLPAGCWRLRVTRTTALRARGRSRGAGQLDASRAY
ncbi:MAG: hypothetical protein H6806_04200 [Planctomycetes bacterium]|nr:hypothetical protein [Planctomycetota bacterium]